MKEQFEKQLCMLQLRVNVVYDHVRPFFVPVPFREVDPGLWTRPRPRQRTRPDFYSLTRFEISVSKAFASLLTVRGYAPRRPTSSSKMVPLATPASSPSSRCDRADLRRPCRKPGRRMLLLWPPVVIS